MKIKWDETGKRIFHAGVDRGVLYPMSENGTYPKGVAWNGLSKVSESPSGAEPSAVYADNRKYLSLYSAEEYKATVEAYTYPDEFESCDGSKEVAPGATIGQQDRQAFGLSYRSLIGNDVKDVNYGYKIHIIYNCKAAPTEVSHDSINESPEAAALSWELSTTPIDIPGFKPSATFVIDSTKLTTPEQKEMLAQIEDILYGKDAIEAVMVDGEEVTPASDAVEPRLPLPSELIAMLKTVSA